MVVRDFDPAAYWETELASIVRQDVPELGLKMAAAGVSGIDGRKAGATDAPKGKACGCRVGGGERMPRAAWLVGLLLVVAIRRRRP